VTPLAWVLHSYLLVSYVMGDVPDTAYSVAFGVHLFDYVGLPSVDDTRYEHLEAALTSS